MNFTKVLGDVRSKIANTGSKGELTISTDAHNHEEIVTDDSDPLIRNESVDVTTQAADLLRVNWVGLSTQRWGRMISSTIKEEERVIRWLLEDKVDQESKYVDHNDEYPKRIEVEAELSVHPGSDPVNGVRVSATLKDVDGEADLAEKEEGLERQPMAEEAIGLHGTKPNHGGEKRHAENIREINGERGKAVSDL